MILYLHGFRSSPQSMKARLTGERMAQLATAEGMTERVATEGMTERVEAPAIPTTATETVTAKERERA